MTDSSNSATPLKILYVIVQLVSAITGVLFAAGLIVGGFFEGFRLVALAYLGFAFLSTGLSAVYFVGRKEIAWRFELDSKGDRFARRIYFFNMFVAFACAYLILFGGLGWG